MAEINKEKETEKEEKEERTEASSKKEKEKEGKKPSKKEADEWKKEKEELTKKLAEETDSRLRLAAEYDNYRRRSAKEREGVYADAFCDALKEILPIIDNLERAEAFLKEDDQLSEGVRLTLSQVKTTLEKLGVTPIGETGIPFDPLLHNAVMHTEDENLPENTVTQVFAKGYQKGDKVIRYAMVSVAN